MALVRELRKNIRGDVIHRTIDLEVYSHDESIFEVQPEVVVRPRDVDDVVTLVEIASRHRASITSRGGGTSTAGQAIGPGIIADFSKYFTRVLDLSADKCIVEPGVVLDDLNRMLAAKGRRIAPDPSSRAWCTIGGMVANNASGPHSFRYGDTRRATHSLKLVLANGRKANSNSLADVVSIPAVGNWKPKENLRKNSSGYDLSGIRDGKRDLTSLIVGSEGTLAMVTEIELDTISLPRRPTTAIFSFETMSDAMKELDVIRASRPVAIELIDEHLLAAMEDFGDRANNKASLWVEWEGEARALSQKASHVILDPGQQQRLWQLRSKASKRLQEKEESRKPLRCIEDGVVPIHRLFEYIEELHELLLSYDSDGAIFGHAGDGHIHVNPMIDVTRPNLWEFVERLMEDWYHLIEKLGGSISGEHGDGLLRRALAQRQWKESLPIMRAVKKAFDPKGIFNQDKKFGDGPKPLLRSFFGQTGPVCLSTQPPPLALGKSV